MARIENKFDELSSKFDQLALTLQAVAQPSIEATQRASETSVPNQAPQEESVPDQAFAGICRHVRACHFRSDDIRVVAEFVDNEDYLVSADIKNGFYHVPVHVEDREYLSFAWRGAYYQLQRESSGLTGEAIETYNVQPALPP